MKNTTITCLLWSECCNIFRKPLRSAANRSVFILGENYLITFQENTGDVFEGIRQRIRTDKGRIRKMGCDFLADALIDAIVDHYFTILELIGEKIETFEEQILYESR